MPEAPLERLPTDWQSALAIVAHPDDLEYGASCAFAKWTSEGKKVRYLLATRGEAGIDSMTPDVVGSIREREEIEAAHAVGVDTVEFLGLTDGLVEYGLDLRCALARSIRRLKPDLLVTGHFGPSWAGGHLNQADHRAVGLATCDAARDAGNRWIFAELLADGLEPWNGLHYVLVHGGQPATHYCEISDGDLHRGIRSLEAHKLYFGNLSQAFDAAKFLTESASGAGRRNDCAYAIEFQLLRV